MLIVDRLCKPWCLFTFHALWSPFSRSVFVSVAVYLHIALSLTFHASPQPYLALLSIITDCCVPLRGAGQKREPRHCLPRIPCVRRAPRWRISQCVDVPQQHLQVSSPSHRHPNRKLADGFLVPVLPSGIWKHAFKNCFKKKNYWYNQWLLSCKDTDRCLWQDSSVLGLRKKLCKNYVPCIYLSELVLQIFILA